MTIRYLTDEERKAMELPGLREAIREEAAKTQARVEREGGNATVLLDMRLIRANAASVQRFWLAKHNARGD